MRIAISLLLPLVLVVSSCGSSNVGEPSAPATLDGALTPTAPPGVTPIVVLLSETATAPPTVTAAATRIPTSTEVANMAIVSVLNLNVRGGPGTGYVILGQIHDGDTLPIIGRTPSGGWLETVYSDRRGWIFAEYVVVETSLEDVPVTGVDPSATPIAPPAVRPTDAPVAPPAVRPTDTPIAPPVVTPIAPPAVTATPTPIAPPPVPPTATYTPTVTQQ